MQGLKSNQSTRVSFESCYLIPRSTSSLSTGVLYEWDTFQVGLKMQMDQGSQCKMIFYYGNKDASNTLTNLTVSFANTPSSCFTFYLSYISFSSQTQRFFCRVFVICIASELRMQAKPETIESVGPRQQTPHYFLWHCMQPFDEAPTVQLNFTKQASHEFTSTNQTFSGSDLSVLVG